MVREADSALFGLIYAFVDACSFYEPPCRDFHTDLVHCNVAWQLSRNIRSILILVFIVVSCVMREPESCPVVLWLI